MDSPVPIHLAVEDTLSEAVLRTILDQCGHEFAVGSCYQHGGYGYLKKRIQGFNQAAKGTPFLVLADLDEAYPCPAALIADWLPMPKHPNLLFRIAVREVEVWVMADRREFASFLGVRSDLIPTDTDQLPNPKGFLMDLVRRSRRRELRRAILPLRGSTARQGPDYNGPLVRFVQNRWTLRRAATNSTSLRRTFDKVSRFAQTWS